MEPKKSYMSSRVTFKRSFGKIQAKQRPSQVLSAIVKPTCIGLLLFFLLYWDEEYPYGGPTQLEDVKIRRYQYFWFWTEVTHDWSVIPRTLSTSFTPRLTLTNSLSTHHTTPITYLSFLFFR